MIWLCFSHRILMARHPKRAVNIPRCYHSSAISDAYCLFWVYRWPLLHLDFSGKISSHLRQACTVIFRKHSSHRLVSYFPFSYLWNNFTFCFYRKLRNDQIAAKILLHLCASLLCVLIVFVSGVERGSVSEDACRIVAALVHYFLLVAFLWMLIEAYFMYQAFVKVFRDYGDYVMWKCSALGWGKSKTAHLINCLVSRRLSSHQNWPAKEGGNRKRASPVICLLPMVPRAS